MDGDNHGIDNEEEVDNRLLARLQELHLRLKDGVGHGVVQDVGPFVDEAIDLFLD
nr:hypothetical protein [Olegusella massiliensis]